jgi:E3 ubiquitin-protein ligase HUWE1
MFRKLTALHTRVTLLADIFSSATHVHGRSALSLLPGLVGSEATGVLADLGALHRACIWENIVLKGALTARGLSPGRNAQTSSLEAMHSTAQANANAVLNGPDAISAIQELENSLEEQKPNETTKKESPQERNAKALKHIATQIPTSLTPFFQGWHIDGLMHFVNLLLW